MMARSSHQICNPKARVYWMVDTNPNLATPMCFVPLSPPTSLCSLSIQFYQQRHRMLGFPKCTYLWTHESILYIHSDVSNTLEFKPCTITITTTSPHMQFNPPQRSASDELTSSVQNSLISQPLDLFHSYFWASYINHLRQIQLQVSCGLYLQNTLHNFNIGGTPR